MVTVGWAVASLAPRQSGRVIDYLTDLGIEVFFPVVKKPVIVRKRHAERFYPLFPTYLFVKIAEMAGWHVLYDAPGVRAILSSGRDPAVIADTDIDDVRSRCDKDGVYTGKTYQKGDSVRVLEGMFEGIVGTYDADDQILVEIFGQPTRVRLRESMICRA